MSFAPEQVNTLDLSTYHEAPLSSMLTLTFVSRSGVDHNCRWSSYSGEYILSK